MCEHWIFDIFRTHLFLEILCSGGKTLNFKSPIIVYSSKWWFFTSICYTCEFAWLIPRSRQMETGLVEDIIPSSSHTDASDNVVIGQPFDSSEHRDISEITLDGKLQKR